MLKEIKALTDNKKVKYIVTLNTPELKVLVKELGIKGAYKMKKAQLQELIINYFFPGEEDEEIEEIKSIKTYDLPTVEEYQEAVEAGEESKRLINRKINMTLAMTNKVQLRLLAEMRLGLDRKNKKIDLIDFICDCYKFE